MPYDFSTTHDNILGSAMRHFTASGYRGASIRAICSDAGVTNGAFYAHFGSKEDLFSALVEDCVSGFSRLYDSYAGPVVASKEDVIAVFSSSYVSVEELIRYIYSHRDEFMLILKCSGGSSYESFAEELIAEESRNTMLFLESARGFMDHPENISARVARGGSEMVIRQALSAFTEGVSMEENIRDTRLLSDFCAAGYRATLGI